MVRPTTPLQDSWVLVSTEFEGEVTTTTTTTSASIIIDESLHEESGSGQNSGTLSLHPNDVAAWMNTSVFASLWPGSVLRMSEEKEGGEGANEGKEEEKEEEEEEEQQQQQEDEGAAAEPAAASEQENEGEKGDNSCWWKRMTTLIIKHLRAIVKTLSVSPSATSIPEELRLACPYLRSQPRQRVLLVTVVVPVSVVVAVTAAVLAGVCCSSSSSSSSNSRDSVKGGGCPMKGREAITSEAVKARLLRVL